MTYPVDENGGGSGTDPDFTTLSEGQVPKANVNSKLVYGGATVDTDTGEWTFDNAINVPSGTLNVSDTLSISEATLALIVRDNVLGTSFTGVQASIDDSGSSFPFITEAPSVITIESQPDDSTLITTNPLTIPTLASFDNETDIFKLRAQSAMTNVRLTLTDVSTGIVLKYLPNKAAVNSGMGGFDFVAGDNIINLNSNDDDTAGVFNVGFTPLRSNAGEVGSILIEADNMALLGNSSDIPFVENEIHPLFTSLIARQFDTSNIADNYVRINNENTSTTGSETGLLTTYLADATADTVTDGQLTAGVASTSNPTAITDGAATFAQNDLIQITGSVLNSGLYEVESHVGTLLTVRGVGTVATVENFTSTDFIACVETVTITKVNVSIIRAGSDGLWELGLGSETPITFSEIADKDYVDSDYTGGDGVDITGDVVSIDRAEAGTANRLVLSSSPEDTHNGTYTESTFAGTVTETTGLAVADSDYIVYKKDDGSGGYVVVVYYGDTPLTWDSIATNIDPDTWTDSNTTGTLGNVNYLVQTLSEDYEGQFRPETSNAFGVSYTVAVVDSMLEFDDVGGVYVKVDTVESGSSTDLSTAADIKDYADSVSLSQSDQTISNTQRDLDLNSGATLDIESYDLLPSNYTERSAVNISSNGTFFNHAVGNGDGNDTGAASLAIYNTGTFFLDTISQTGIRYGSSGTYANATDLTLMPKEYIDGLTNTFSNGLTETSGAVVLGGALTAETTINGDETLYLEMSELFTEVDTFSFSTTDTNYAFLSGNGDSVVIGAYDDDSAFESQITFDPNGVVVSDRAFGKGISYADADTYANADDLTLIPYVAAKALYTAGDGLSVLDQEFAVSLVEGVAGGNLELNGMITSAFDGEYEASTFSGTLTTTGFTVVANPSFKMWKKYDGSTGWYVAYYDNDLLLSWLVGYSLTDPDTWVDGGASGMQISPSIEILTSTSELQDGQFTPSDTSIYVTYTEAVSSSFLEFDSGDLKVSVSDDFDNPTSDTLSTTQGVYDFVQESTQVLTAGEGIVISNDIINVELVDSTSDGDLVITGATNPDYDGTYSPSTFNGTVSFLSIVREDSLYAVFVKDDGSGGYHAVYSSSDFSDFWNVGATTTDPDTWVDGGASGTGSEEFITSSSEFQDTKLVPSSSSALVSYPSESAGSYLEFDSGKLKAVVSDDFTTPSELALPTQQSVYDLVQSSSTSIDVSSTRIVSGSEVTVNSVDDTTWDLAAGSAEIYRFETADTYGNPTKTTLSWDAQSGLAVTDIASIDKTNLGITSDNTARSGIDFSVSFSGLVDGVAGTLYIAQKAAEDPRFSIKEKVLYAEIGRLFHRDLATLNGVANRQSTGNGLLNKLQAIYSVLGLQNINGNEYSAVTGTATVQKSAGESFDPGTNATTDPEVTDTPTNDQDTEVSFLYDYWDGSDWVRGFWGSSFPFDTWNDYENGTLETASSNKWLLHYVFLFSDTNISDIQLGQTEYSSYESALADYQSASFNFNDDLLTTGVYRGAFICRAGETTTDGGDWYWIAPSGSVISGQSSGSALTTLQTAYDASIDKGTSPEIIVQDVASAGVTIQDSATNVNRDTIFHVVDSSGNDLLCVDSDDVEIGGELSSTTRASSVSAVSTSLLNLDCGDLGTSRFFVSMLYDQDLFQIGRFDDAEGDYLGFQFSSDGITAHDDIHGTGIEYQALTDIENATSLSLMHKQYIDDNSIMLSDTTFTDGVSRVVTGEDDSDLQFRFFDTDSDTFTQEGSWLLSDNEMNFACHDGDGAGAQTDTIAFTLSLAAGIQVLDSKFNKGITYVDVNEANFSDDSVPNVSYVKSTSFAYTNQTITGPTNRTMNLEQSANLQFISYDTDSSDYSDRSELIFDPARLQLRYDEGDQAGGTNGYAELDFESAGVTLTNTLPSATTLFDITDGVDTFFDVTKTGTDVKNLRAVSVQSDNEVAGSGLKHREYYFFAGSGGGAYYVGNVKDVSSINGGIDLTVHFAYDYSTQTNHYNVHAQIAQRNSGFDAYWYKTGDVPDASEPVYIEVIDDGVDSFEVWIVATDFAACRVEATIRQGGEWADSGTLTAATITAGTTIADTRDDSNLRMEVGDLASFGTITTSDLLALDTPITTPATPSSGGSIYIDSADGDLKVIFSNGTIATLASN